MTRTNIYLPMTALILAALAIPAAAQTQVAIFKKNQQDGLNETEGRATPA